MTTRRGPRGARAFLTNGQLIASSTRTADWRDQGACREEDPDLFFPAGSTGPFALQIEEAKAVCHGCPVMQTCLREALRTKPEGVWGGTTEDERRAMTRQSLRGRTASPITSGKDLAVRKGVSVLHLVGRPEDIPAAAKQLGATEDAVTFAVRLLAPDMLPPAGSLTVLERTLTMENSLRTLQRGGRRQAEIARVVGCSQSTAAAALAVLDQIDQYNVTQATAMEVAA